MSEQAFKRIDPAAIPALFEKHGMRPRQREFYCEIDGTRCCCVNTILAAETVGRETAIQRAEPLEAYVDAEFLAPCSGIDPRYAVGLAEGWDGSDIGSEFATTQGLAGYNDGRAAWDACQSLLKEVAS